jgi:hypothetical protein
MSHRSAIGAGLIRYSVSRSIWGQLQWPIWTWSIRDISTHVPDTVARMAKRTDLANPLSFQQDNHTFSWYLATRRIPKWELQSHLIPRPSSHIVFCWSEQVIGPTQTEGEENWTSTSWWNGGQSHISKWMLQGLSWTPLKTIYCSPLSGHNSLTSYMQTVLNLFSRNLTPYYVRLRI